MLPPAGKFQKEYLYIRKYWRRVQHLANEFWCRWLHVSPDKNGGVWMSSYLLIHTMVRKQCWTDQYTKLFYLLMHRKVQFPNKETRTNQDGMNNHLRGAICRNSEEETFSYEYSTMERLCTWPISGSELLDVAYLIT